MYFPSDVPTRGINGVLHMWGGSVVDKPTISKVKLFFWFVFIFSLSISVFFIFTYYIFDYINESEVVKVYPPLFFVFSAPLLMYFSFVILIMIINREVLGSKILIFRRIFKFLAFFAALSFVFMIIGPMYMDSNLISKGYIKCHSTPIKLQTVYVINESLCGK